MSAARTPQPVFYYDLGDPIGFDLEITREWLLQNGWLSSTATPGVFQFAKTHDYGFVRYPFPGKAHNDYWEDPEVFGNFIDGVILRSIHQISGDT